MNVTTNPVEPLAISHLAEDRISLVLGITGHRNTVPEDERALRDAFASIVAELRGACPTTPLVVICGMASGADTFAADEAFALNIPVIACLAAPPERFELDFPQDERAAFRARLARCVRVDIVSDVPEQITGYLAVKRYLNRFSHVLIAFWDGEPSDRPAGTSAIVHARLTGAHMSDGDALAAPVAPDIGPVYHVVTARVNGPAPEGRGDVRQRYPVRRGAGDSARDFTSALKRIELCNADMARARANSQAAWATGVGFSAIREAIDEAANRLQRTTLIFLNMLFVFGWIAAVATVLSDNTTRVVTLAIAFGSYWLARRSDFQNRYQDYRALSEALRVQEAWNSVGLEYTSVDASYLKMQQTELEWIRMTIRSLNLVFSLDPAYVAASNRDDYLSWIDGQVKFFRKTAKKNYALGQRLGRAGQGAVFGGLGLGTIMLAVAHGDPRIAAHVPGMANYIAPFRPELERFGAAFMTLGGVFAALVSGYAERRHFESNAKRYERMLILFDDARARLDDIARGRPGERSALVRELGREALVEHADWLLARRERPLVFIQGA